ncbi:hypothetical protein ACVDG5_000530 [Mesorhizobium sp. ORM6]
MKQGLRVGQELRSRIISIGFTDRDPARAAQVANTVAAVYVGNLALQNRAADQRDLASIVSRLPEMQGELARATDQLQTFRLTNAVPDRGTADDSGREIAELGRQISLVKANLAAVEARLERIRDLHKTGAPATDLAAAIGSPVLMDPKQARRPALAPFQRPRVARIETRQSRARSSSRSPASMPKGISIRRR